MSKKQMRVYAMVDWIVDYMLLKNYPPNQYEISLAFDRSHSTISAWINVAKELNLVKTYGRGKSRAIIVPGVHYIDDRDGDKFYPIKS